MNIDQKQVLNFKDLATDSSLVGARNAVAVPDLGIAISVVKPGVHLVYTLNYDVVAETGPKGIRVYANLIKAFWTYDIYYYLLFDNALVEIFTDEELCGGVEVHYRDGREQNASWIVGATLSKPVFFGMVEGDRSKWHKDFI